MDILKIIKNDKKSLAAIIAIAVAVLLLIFLGTGLSEKIKNIQLGSKPTHPSSPTGKAEISPEIALTSSQAIFSFQGPTTITTNQILPMVLKFKMGETPANKGITGIRAVINFPAEKLALTPEKIQTALSEPWQYVRKEVNQNGEIIIEAVYLRGSQTGDLSTKEQILATLNFTAQAAGEISLDINHQKSYLLTKEGNQKIYSQNNLYFNGEVVK